MHLLVYPVHSIHAEQVQAWSWPMIISANAQIGYEIVIRKTFAASFPNMPSGESRPKTFNSDLLRVKYLVEIQQKEQEAEYPQKPLLLAWQQPKWTHIC